MEQQRFKLDPVQEASDDSRGTWHEPGAVSAVPCAQAQGCGWAGTLSFLGGDTVIRQRQQLGWCAGWAFAALQRGCGRSPEVLPPARGWPSGQLPGNYYQGFVTIGQIGEMG